MNTNLIHKWLRDPKFAPDSEIVEEQVAETPCFLPVEIVDSTPAKDTASTTVHIAFCPTSQALTFFDSVFAITNNSPPFVGLVACSLFNVTSGKLPSPISCRLVKMVYRRNHCAPPSLRL